MHGFLVLRQGQIASEGYWAPYTEDSMHRMYSVSKSFVSLAVGLMIDEGKLRLDDRVARYFDDLIPEDLHSYLADSTVRDLLMMSTAHSYTSYTRTDANFAKTFFLKKPSHPPGTVFSYDTAATVILNAIVERISGVPFLEYMRDRLLNPVGFTKEAWCIRTPEGTSWGGSGVICKLKDMAKLAYVCLNKGSWNGVQLISEDYIRAATSKQIDNSLAGNYGYGYQIWMEQDNGFSFRGMGSQLALCYPERDLLFACISDTQGQANGEAAIRAAFREEIWAHIRDSPLPEDTATYAKLQNCIGNLGILPQLGERSSSFTQKIHDQWYILEDNPMEISRMRFKFYGDEGVWEYSNASGAHTLAFGVGKNVGGPFPQNNYFGNQIGFIPGSHYQCLASAAWVEEHKLNMLVYVTDIYLGRFSASFAFEDNRISVHMIKAAEWFLDEYQGFAGGVRMEETEHTHC
ncbi:beta-lactamase family protein [Paenibacillus sp. J5C_2022]|uniref:serine hydrolase domain-containing protein n=1 Tax=Paenibacillus sp. J5C2022 TaxID=2977129 RepID=UPI0021CECDCD|nr:serine hydrolase [Paenibacillus sp. J5C2022]MCU6712704.1 beta-lactamase family protein [Paenibacillus sp. J5C2022]